MFFRISCFVRSCAVVVVLRYHTLLPAYAPTSHGGVELSILEAKSRIDCIDIGDVGTAPAATASVEGFPPLHVAVPVLRLSTIGQIAVVSMLNAPRLLWDRNFDGGLPFPIDVDVQPGPLNHTSSAVPIICALSILFMFVADAPLRMFKT